MHPVVIENDAISIEVWPSIGGKVASIIDKADRFQLLFTYPAELPDGPHYDAPYADHFHAGWDECFPAIAPSKYPRHPYEQISVPDHGELWGIPATTAVPTKNGITTVWHGLRFGYRLTRKLYLQDAAIVAEYSLTNLAPFEFRYVWAMHALMSQSSAVELDGSPMPCRISHRATLEPVDENFQWPHGPQGQDFSHPDSLPTGQAWKIYSVKPIDSPMVVRYPARNRSVRLEYTTDQGPAAYWGIWISTGGSVGHQLFSIQPTTGRFDQIDKAIKDNSAGIVSAFARQEWSVRWTLAQI